ncbi:hypothetical protein [Streptomyces sp. NPDC050145]|uniref:hypothetical protein n=1 Tax=Streptomyces sp. NPDC050145 TaxID=3365602 RepID=UPI0037B8EA71
MIYRRSRTKAVRSDRSAITSLIGQLSRWDRPAQVLLMALLVVALVTEENKISRALSALALIAWSVRYGRRTPAPPPPSGSVPGKLTPPPDQPTT